MQCEQLPCLTADTPFPEPWNYGQNDLFLLPIYARYIAARARRASEEGGQVSFNQGGQGIPDKVMLQLKGRNEEREPNYEMRVSRGHRLAEGKPWVASNTGKQQGRGIR